MKNTNDFKCAHLRGHKPAKFIISLLSLFLILFLAVKIAKDIKSYDYIGVNISSPNTISVSGKGEILAKADIATFTFNVIEESANVSDAQNKAAKKINDAVKFLKDSGVGEKDIKTLNYNIYPRYDYIKRPTERSQVIPPLEDSRVLVGYKVDQSIEVKLRKINSAGAVFSGIGSLGASSVGELNFSIDNEDKLKEEARDLAIEDAKENAAALAQKLKVKLVRIVNFSESGYLPIYAEKFSAVSYATGGNGSRPLSEIPTGENKLTSQVNIVYEIR